MFTFRDFNNDFTSIILLPYKYDLNKKLIKARETTYSAIFDASFYTKDYFIFVLH